MDELLPIFQRAVRGDRRAFVDVVERTSDRLYRAALRILGNGADAEEVLQESYLRAHGALRQGRWQDGTKTYGWLLSIVSRACVDALRRRRVRPVPVSDIPESWLIADGGHAEEAARLGELLACMDDLPAEQRAAIVLRYLEGLSNGEVANALGISEGAVEQRLIRAKATLRRRLDGENGK